MIVVIHLGQRNIHCSHPPKEEGSLLDIAPGNCLEQLHNPLDITLPTVNLIASRPVSKDRKSEKNFEREKLAHKICAKNAQNRAKNSKNDKNCTKNGKYH